MRRGAKWHRVGHFLVVNDNSYRIRREEISQPASFERGERRASTPSGCVFQNCRSLQRIWVSRFLPLPAGRIHSPTRSRKKKAMTARSASALSLESMDAPLCRMRSWNTETGNAS
jgi:hypothetical protein